MPPAGKRFFYPRPVLRHPTLDLLLVPLLRPPGWTLSTPIQALQDPPDVTRVVLHSRDLLDHPRHPGQRPKIRRKPPRLRPLTQPLIETPEIRLLESWLTTRASGTTQSRRPILLPGRVPPMNAGPGHSQPTSDLRLAQPTGGKQPPRLLAASFQPLEVATGTEWLVHETSLFLHPATLGPKRYCIIRDSIGGRARRSESVRPERFGSRVPRRK